MSSLIVFNSFETPEASPFLPAENKQDREELLVLHNNGGGQGMSQERDLGILTFVIGTLMHLDIYICAPFKT